MISRDLLIKSSLIVGSLALAFLTGRYTMRGSVTKELETKYERLYSEYQSSTKLSFETKLAEEVASVKSDYETKLNKITETTKTTVISKDGTTTITENTKTKEDRTSKSSESSESKRSDVTTKVDTSDDRSSKQEKVTETVKEIVKITSPRSFRAYGLVEINDIANEKFLVYGAGIMYDIGPVNVGTLGTYSPLTHEKSAGITLGVSF